MKYRIALYAVLLAAGAAQAADQHYFKQLFYTRAQQESLLALELDSQIYAASRDDYRDIRIRDDSGKETPYLLEKRVEPHSETVHVVHAGSVLDMRKKGANGIEVILRAEKDSPPTDGFTLHTPLNNYEHSVRVYGSDDGKSWTPLVESAAIYDYSRYMDVRNQDIALPANRYRQFKLVIDQATQTHQAERVELTRALLAGQEQTRSEQVQLQSVPLRIDHVDFWHNVSKDLPADDKKFAYPVLDFKATQDGKNHWTVVEVTTRRQPLTRLSLQISERHFSRRATLQIPIRQGMETRWQDIGTATIEVLRLGLQREQAGIAFPEQRRETYRVLLHDQDNPPLTISGVQAEGNGYRLLFFAAPQQSYRVYYGSETAAPPRYDTSAISASLRAGYPVASLTTGPEKAVIGVKSGFDWISLLNSKWFLGASITMMMLMLVWALIHAGRHMEEMHED
ncbi:MAG: DUF3999 family protein [Methylococcaceae bacterium]|nr:MAG: DUF3999 family protein [Methylococcaceae bacterium]